MSKRPANQAPLAPVTADKKAKTFINNTNKNGLQIQASNIGDGKEVALQTKRHSMQGPIMLLTGHDGEIFACKFHPSGKILASAGVDRSIYLWSTRDDCKNYAILKAAHANTILGLDYSADGDKLMSCSADKTAMLWDSATGCRLKKLRGHQSFVNAISASKTDANLLATVSDDCQLNIWDSRTRKCVLTYKDRYQLTAVAFGNTSDQVYVGGLENIINAWDLKRGSVHYTLHGHTDTITGLSVSPDGHHLLSNSMDNTLKTWDIRPFAPINRHEKTFLGNQHGFEKNLLRCSWSPKGNMISAGSSDRNVYIWSANSCDILYKLPGHRGSVNEVVFSPREQLVLSCGSDKQLYIGEINYDLV